MGEAPEDQLQIATYLYQFRFATDVHKLLGFAPFWD